MKTKNIFTFLTALILPFAIAACEQQKQKDEEPSSTQAVEKDIKKQADEIGEKVEDLGNKAGDAIEKTEDKIDKKVDEAKKDQNKQDRKEQAKKNEENKKY